MTEPTTAAEPTPYGDVEEVFELAVWIVGLLGYAKKGGYEGEARPGVAWERLRPAILAIEAEARQQDGSALRVALERLIEEYGDDALGIRFTVNDIVEWLAALPPSAPPALPRHTCRQGIEPCAACDAADALSAPPALDRCDKIVNNGEGEPTECGRRWPCEYHTVDR